MRTDKEKAVMAAAAECLRQAGDEEITITGGSDREVIVTRPESQSSSVYTEDEFIAKYASVNAAPGRQHGPSFAGTSSNGSLLQRH